MSDRCCLCSKKVNWETNPIFRCVGCEVTVHRGCYGIATDTDQRNWKCRKCESSEPGNASCKLCPNKDGAFKKTDNDGWAHVICALYIPEVRFANSVTMEPIELREVPSERFDEKCYICARDNPMGKDREGACIRCNGTDCSVFFHVTCAQSAGHLREEIVEGIIKHRGYCENHFNSPEMANSSRIADGQNCNGLFDIYDENSKANEDSGDELLQFTEEPNLSLSVAGNSGEKHTVAVTANSSIVMSSSSTTSPAPPPPISTSSSTSTSGDLLAEDGSESKKDNTTKKGGKKSRYAKTKKHTAVNKTAERTTVDEENPPPEVQQPHTLSAPHMLGNQLNPSSAMAAQLCDSLAAEIQDHSIYDDNESSSARCSYLLGPPLLSSTVAATAIAAASSYESANKSIVHATAGFPDTWEQLLLWKPGIGSSVLPDDYDISCLLDDMYAAHLKNLRLEEDLRKLVADENSVAERNRWLKDRIEELKNSQLTD